MQILHHGKPVKLKVWERIYKFQKVCKHTYGTISLLSPKEFASEKCKRCGFSWFIKDTTPL